MKKYKCLIQSEWISDNFSLIPIRNDDKLAILKMRNEQIYHLRQAELLTLEMQEAYFENVVAKLFDQKNPNQILFTFLEKGEFIGYGGLVHINWIDKNAEVSFIMRTELEKEKFSYYWENYLSLLEKVAFKDLNFHKIFTYAFDLRPHLYSVLEKSGFREEARLKEHCCFQGKYLDVVINSKLNRNA
ncbi:GNAT family N-acetyltransferase [Flavobacterium sp. GN10]|uniref:GNAT family N-acetyltransferase n=1 Tax=Flavobacterium tagetis TaxID=2801336 RepID=A0ABS1KHW3_9FLAO|nr:GNAT family N-acetyltransferase [Flavobacterium tagetis]